MLNILYSWLLVLVHCWAVRGVPGELDRRFPRERFAEHLRDAYEGRPGTPAQTSTARQRGSAFAEASALGIQHPTLYAMPDEGAGLAASLAAPLLALRFAERVFARPHDPANDARVDPRRPYSWGEQLTSPGPNNAAAFGPGVEQGTARPSLWLGRFGAADEQLTSPRVRRGRGFWPPASSRTRNYPASGWVGVGAADGQSTSQRLIKRRGLYLRRPQT